MSIRFAAARTAYHGTIARRLAPPRLVRPANDNDAGVCLDRMLKAALRHFAEYGLGAAANAAMLAEAHHAAGDAESCEWWLSICRTLDKRRAERLAAELGKSRARRVRP